MTIKINNELLNKLRINIKEEAIKDLQPHIEKLKRKLEGKSEKQRLKLFTKFMRSEVVLQILHEKVSETLDENATDLVVRDIKVDITPYH